LLDGPAETCVGGQAILVRSILGRLGGNHPPDTPRPARRLK
jgi:hypothetical protein